MNIAFTWRQCWIAFLLPLILSSCANPATKTSSIGADSLTHNPHTSETPPDSIAQIGDYVVAIHEDRRGHLWFGTVEKGVARHDGHQLTYFTKEDGLPDNTVLSFVEDTAGHLWMGTHSGVVRFDGESFRHYGYDQGLSGMGAKLLIDRNGSLWVGTNTGLFRYHEQGINGSNTYFMPVLIPEPEIDDPSYKWVKGKIWDLMEDRKGNIWLARDGLGVCRYDGKTFTHFTTRDGLSSNNVAAVIEDNLGNIWFGSISSDFPEYQNHGGVSRFDGKTITQFPHIEGLSNNDIYTIKKDRSGHVWIGAIGVGAYRHDGKEFTLFNTIDRPDRAEAFAIQAFLEDSQGRLWFGFSGGLFRFDGESFINVTRDGPWR